MNLGMLSVNSNVNLEMLPVANILKERAGGRGKCKHVLPIEQQYQK